MISQCYCFKIFVFIQSMETGVPGLLGALAAKVAEAEPRLEPVCATILHQKMVGQPVWEARLNPKHVTPNHALPLQVIPVFINYIYPRQEIQRHFQILTFMLQKCEIDIYGQKDKKQREALNFD